MTDRPEMFIWLAVADEATCMKCLDRHAEVATMEQWKAKGLPGSCGCRRKKGCRCELHPYRGNVDGPDPEVDFRGPR